MNATNAHKLIADIDPALAALWVRSPFQRHNIVTAFHASLSNSKTFGHLADQIAVALRSAIDFEQGCAQSAAN